MAARVELTPEQLQRAVDLRGRRFTFSAISRELKIDRRIIAQVVLKQEETLRWKELSGARRDVAAKYLEIHVSRLSEVSGDLLQLTIPPGFKDKNTSVETNVGDALTIKAEERLKPIYVTDMSRTVEQLYSEERLLVDTRLSRREARELIEAHQEHFPSVWKIIAEWQKVAVRYNVAWKQFVVEFERGCERMRIPRDLRKSAVLELLKREIPDSDGDKSFVKLSTPVLTLEQATNQLIDDHTIRTTLKYLFQYRASLQSLFEQLEGDLTPAAQQRAILTGNCEYCPVP